MFLMTAIGFTNQGILANSIAALLHSTIGSVPAGSLFAILQSFGALHFGILGPYYLFVTLATGLVFGAMPFIRKIFPGKK